MAIKVYQKYDDRGALEQICIDVYKRQVLDRKKRITCAVQFSCFVLLGSNTAAWAFRGYYIVHVRNIL